MREREERARERERTERERERERERANIEGEGAIEGVEEERHDVALHDGHHPPPGRPAHL